MLIFFFFYGIAEIANAIYCYGILKKEWYHLIVTSFWALTFILVSLSGTLEFNGFVRSLIYFLHGVGWLFMTSTPCTIKLSKKNGTTVKIRKIIFIIMAIAAFLAVSTDLKIY